LFQQKKRIDLVENPSIMADKSKRLTLSLKDVPDDVYEILLTEQGRIKLEKKCGKFGLAQVIYKMVRQYRSANAEKGIHAGANDPIRPVLRTE
jgi:hypothetical protein